jgi:anti-sigma regulatory factor (Ser/Thr protein kinase)
MAGHWPLHSYLELGALPSAVPCARLHARELLWKWGLADLTDTIELIVSELVTNGIKANRAMRDSFPVRLWMLSDRVRVVVLAWDRHPRSPVRVDPGEDADCGRGLVLVEALSDEWGWCPHRDIGGKVVWSEVSLPTHPAQGGHHPRQVG